MGERRDFEAEKLVIGVLSGDAAREPAVMKKLTAEFGRIDYQSDRFPFTFTSYYEEEMGSVLTRFFLGFERLISPERLAAVKIDTNRMERDAAVDGRRKINLDPGLVSLSRFVLASTKNSSHRIPLRDGIYAEIELMYEYGSFRPVEWTYADYRSSAYIKILNHAREIYKENLKASGNAPAS
ncbi:MAG TPA: DUF4416 family protein [Spirochaetia bacterium]|nr:DUF4416 family protein [Spirochaetia bacterium]